MSVQIELCGPIREKAGARALLVRATTVGEAIGALRERVPALSRYLDGKGFLNLYLSGEDVRFLGGMNTPIRPGDTLCLVPSVSGG